MKVVHIESGLGNQMLSYCELLALRSVQPKEKFYLETIVFDIEEACGTICQWNGYELDKIFLIPEPNICELFTQQEWKIILDRIRNSAFWEKSWNWPVYFTEAFREQGLDLNNLRGDFEETAIRNQATVKGKLRRNKIYQRFQNTSIYANMRTCGMRLKPHDSTDVDYLYYTGGEDCLTGQKLTLMYKNNNIECIDAEIRKVFRFSPFEDMRNREMERIIVTSNSVAIHARRGDLLHLNGRYYKGGYFKRSVKYIKKYVDNPVFIFFCDPGSLDWCQENERVFGLDFKHDRVFFVDWNKGKESYRDMQLMSLCKHNIITISSFGWWGAYLNRNPNKITISPEIEINTTHHF